MSFTEKSDMQLIHEATICTDRNILNQLSNCANMNVRRAIAKNRNIDSFTANKLLFDPVLNVSYTASQNPNCTRQRDFKEHLITPCVKCSVDERELDCVNCQYSKNS